MGRPTAREIEPARSQQKPAEIVQLSTPFRVESSVPVEFTEPWSWPPAAEGNAYARVEKYELGQAIRLGAFSDVEVRVSDVLK